MPLFTYVVVYDGEIFVSQRRRSNFQGYGDWADQLPDSLRQKVHLYGGFEPIPNRENVWRNVQSVDGHDLVVVAILTES
jgi:hypothetical protein